MQSYRSKGTTEPLTIPYQQFKEALTPLLATQLAITHCPAQAQINKHLPTSEGWKIAAYLKTTFENQTSS